MISGRAACVRTMSAFPRPPARVPHQVKYGVVEGENRGSVKEALFDPAVTRTDPYFWLRDDDRKSEKVIDYLKEENDYCKSATEHIESFSNEIYLGKTPVLALVSNSANALQLLQTDETKPPHHALPALEMKSHLKETDQEVPWKVGSLGWRYFTRTIEGKSYKLHCRTMSESNAEEDLQGDGVEVVLDENEVAKGLAHCDVGCVTPSPSGRLVAYSVDSTGYETYKVYLRDLEAKALVENEVIEETTGDVTWGLDDSVIFYSKQDKVHRPHQLWCRVRGEGGEASDQLLFQEDDERFWLGSWKSRSGKILFCGCRSKETTEVWMIDLAAAHEAVESSGGAVDLKAFLKIVSPRDQGTIYKVDHAEAENHLVFVTNAWGKQEFTLCAAPVDKPSKENWFEMESFKYDPAKYLLGAYCFKDFVVVSGREGGLTRLWILRLSSGSGKLDVSSCQRVEFDEEAYEVNFSARNKVFDADEFRVIYSSMVTPDSTMMISSSGVATPIKVEEVPHYDPSMYATLRLEAPARDGTMIPLSVVFKKDDDFVEGGDLKAQFMSRRRPTYLYGYGSYGACMDPSFGMSRLPLLDRGMAYVIAHIRGGSELGRKWYQTEGKYLAKCNTFDDFIDCGKFLKEHVASSIAIEGRSAGGLLIGASMNRAPPGLFDVAVAGVPFVDVMTTMCDPSIPLTVIEWEEWGNPNEPKYHDYILGYSPIDNVGAESSAEAGSEKSGVQDYPALLITAGLHDPRVAYWEPAKWMATMRHTLAEAKAAGADIRKEPLLLLKTDLTSGHFSASDRYKWLKERSFDYAFVLDQLGMTPKAKI